MSTATATSTTRSAPSVPVEPRRLSPLEHGLLAIHQTLFPERYEGVDLHEWSADTIDQVARQLESIAAALEIPGFVLTPVVPAEPAASRPR